MSEALLAEGAASQVLLPSQSESRCSLGETGPRALLAELLLDACRCARGEFGGHERTKAWAWLEGRTPNPDFSFAMVCGELGLDPDALLPCLRAAAPLKLPSRVRHQNRSGVDYESGYMAPPLQPLSPTELEALHAAAAIPRWSRRCPVCKERFDARAGCGRWRRTCSDACTRRRATQKEIVRRRRKRVITRQLCACGCGLPTYAAIQTCRKHGYVNGEPVRFRRGHHRKGPMSPVRTRNSYPVAATRLRAEKALGRYLRVNEFAYELSGGLVVGRRGYNNLLRYRMQAFAATGNAAALRCVLCGSWTADRWGRPVVRVRMHAGRSSIAHLACHRARFAAYARDRKQRTRVVDGDSQAATG